MIIFSGSKSWQITIAREGLMLEKKYRWIMITCQSTEWVHTLINQYQEEVVWTGVPKCKIEKEEFQAVTLIFETNKINPFSYGLLDSLAPMGGPRRPPLNFKEGVFFELMLL